MLDEPLAASTRRSAGACWSSVERLRAEGITILFIEHDLEAVMNHSDRVVVMGQGRVIAEGEPDAVSADRAVIDAYLGGAEEAA